MGREYYQRQDVQACRVCGRLFVKRKGDICSMSCKAKADGEPEGRDDL
jgi:hypothetical protein